MDARDGYAKLRSPLLRCLARSPLLAVAAHWALQSLLYMDRTERCAKLGLDLALALLVRLLVAPWLPDLAAWAAAVVAAHTANFLLNGHLWGVLKHYGFVRHSRAAFAGYVEGFLARAAREPAIDSVWICGSLSREAWSPASDLDVRLLRRPGLANGARACWFLLRERSRALCARFPLDAYVVDSRQGLLERGISSAGQAVGHTSRPDAAHESTARTGPNLRKSAQSADGDSPPRGVNSHMNEPFSFADALRHIARDLRVNRGLRWDNLRAMLLLVEFRLEQYVYRVIGWPGHPLRPAWHACRFAGSVYQWLLCNSNLPGRRTWAPSARSTSTCRWRGTVSIPPCPDCPGSATASCSARAPSSSARSRSARTCSSVRGRR